MDRRRHIIAGLVGCGISLSAGLSPSSEAAAQVPSTLDPARLRENLEAPRQLRTQPSISLPRAEEGVVPKEAAKVTFVLGGIEIDGNSVLSDSQLLANWPHKVGDTVRVDEVFALAGSISRAYEQAGYALSFAVVPQQQIENGVFRIQVVEGYVERVEIKGDLTEAVRSSIQRRAERIEASRPLRTADLERNLLLISDLPGVEVSTVLSPAAARAGAVLTLEARHKPVAGYAGYNNFMPDSLGTHVFELGGQLQGLLTGSDVIALSARRSVESAAYLSLSADASAGVGSDGFRIGLQGEWSEVDPHDVLLDALEYDGYSVSARIYGEYPIIRSREQSLLVGAAFSLDDNHSTILGTDFVDDQLRSISVWSAYEFADPTRAMNSIRATMTHGVDLFGASGNSRENGVLEYTKLELEFQRRQPLGVFFDGDFSLSLAGYGQIALGPGALFSGAECSYGGRRFGRGFDAGVLTGDDCAMGGAELHWARSVDLPNLSEPLVLDLYAFMDGGFSWQKGEVLSGEVREAHAGSMGIGLNLQFTSWASGLVEISQPVSLSHGSKDDTRVVGLMRVRF